MSTFRRNVPNRADFGKVYADVARNAPLPPRRERLTMASESSLFDRLFMPVVSCASLSFCVFAVITSLNDPEYYSQKLISSLLKADVDPIRTGTTSLSNTDPDSLPVPSIQRGQPLTPGDYQIVMVFEGEAILATNDELMRVKVGSVLPGLGEVRQIVADGAGGTIGAEYATLKSAPN